MDTNEAGSAGKCPVMHPVMHGASANPPLSAGAFEIEIIGERRKATIVEQPLFDPEGKRMRS